MNIGLHNKQIAEKYMSRGKYILNKDNYRPKTGKEASENYTSINVETLVTIQKKNISHWALKNMPLEFIVRSHSNWFAHNICLTDKELKYLVLSSCPKGPIIIEHTNTIGLGFNISKKYPHTMVVLENFIKAKMLEDKNKIAILRTTGEETKLTEGKTRKAITINKVIANVKPCSTISRKLSNVDLVDQARPYTKLKSVKEMSQNVGFNFNSRDKIIVENNSIDTRPITAKGHNFFSEKKEAEAKIMTSENNMMSEVKAPLSTTSVPWITSEEKDKIEKKNKKFELAKAPTEREQFREMIENSEKRMHEIIGESKHKIFKEVMAIHSVKDKIVHKIADIDNFYSERAKSPKNKTEMNNKTLSNIEYITNNLYQSCEKKVMSNYDYVQAKSKNIPYNPSIPNIIYDNFNKPVHVKSRLKSANKGYIANPLDKDQLQHKHKDKDKNQCTFHYIHFKLKSLLFR